MTNDSLQETQSQRRLTTAEYINGIKSGNRATLAQAITLVESKNLEHQEQSQELLLGLMPETGKSFRIGITGVPGAGKSTLIDALGVNLVLKGHKVAVLAVDPSSTRTGGAILGDKTRMAQLATQNSAFIRPSPTSGTLGGVTRATRESILICEAYGFDIILIETVGVGQSEVAVSQMVDFFMVLLVAGAGDELQGIKKGILEIADLIAINKCDGKNKLAAETSALEYQQAIRIVTPKYTDWIPPVKTVSALQNTGLNDIWSLVAQRHKQLDTSGQLIISRQNQQVKWMWEMVENKLLNKIKTHAGLQEIISDLERQVCDGSLTPTLAVEKIFNKFRE